MTDDPVTIGLAVAALGLGLSAGYAVFMFFDLLVILWDDLRAVERIRRALAGWCRRERAEGDVKETCSAARG